MPSVGCGPRRPAGHAVACADAVRQRGAQGALRLHLGALLVQLHVERADFGAWGVYTWQENQEEVQAQARIVWIVSP